MLFICFHHKKGRKAYEPHFRDEKTGQPCPVTGLRSQSSAGVQPGCKLAFASLVEELSVNPKAVSAGTGAGDGGVWGVEVGEQNWGRGQWVIEHPPPNTSLFWAKNERPGGLLGSWVTSGSCGHTQRARIPWHNRPGRV